MFYNGISRSNGKKKGSGIYRKGWAEIMSTKTALQEQYAYIRGSREVVFQYCKGMEPSDFVKELDAFGR